MRLGCWEGLLRKGKRWLQGIWSLKSNRSWRGKMSQTNKESKICRNHSGQVWVSAGNHLQLFWRTVQHSQQNDAGVVCLHAGLSEPQLAREALKPGECWQNCCYSGRLWMNFTLTRFPFSLVDVYTSKFYSPVFWSVQAWNLRSVAESHLS